MDAAFGDGALLRFRCPCNGADVSYGRKSVEPRRFRFACGSGGTTIFPAGYSLVPAGKWLRSI